VFAGTARLYQTTIDTYEGKFGSATEKLEQDILLDRKGRGTAAELKRRELLARLALLRNDRAEVRRQVNLVLAKIADGPGAEEPLRRAAALLALIGDVHGARPLVARLARLRDSLGSAFAQSCHDAALGELSLAEGQTERAIDAFRQADAEYWRPMTTQGLARAYAAAGDWTRAREQWSKFIGSRGEIFHQGFAADWVLGYLELARAEQHAGDIAAARRHYETFLALWRGGDDVPARRRATEEQRSLAAFSAGTPASR